MPLNLPEGKKIAVNIGADFDAHAVWMGTFDKTSPSYLSRGEYCATVGVPRLLDLFERYDIQGTWCTPVHTMETFPDAFARIVEAGQEVAAHGCYHESVPSLDRDTEIRLMEQTIEGHLKHVGKAPRGYRSPAWDFTEHTLELLEKTGFEWDSSLMGHDFQPYHPRPVDVRWEEGSVFGPPSPLLEFPVSWYLDDFPVGEYIPGVNPGLGSSEVMFQRFQDHFDFAYQRETDPVLAITLHPQTAARAHHLLGLERLLDHMASHEGVWFASLSDIYDTWTED
ncbi:polysaccharide deacetylase family protein [Nocardioides humi]|uniref:Polysaccharide deacetylase n=1 Tax=Nocardioides humi TaxID=449461 RepID=A0ABN1ZSV1_9ACTN|nr:polysaccharide deacetylase [Nocardioides humi]